MVSKTSYSFACGPRALSALVEETPARARPAPISCAGLLLAIQRHRQRHTAPGSSPDDMALALLRFGYAVEPYDSRTGEPIETAEAYADRLRAELQRDHGRELGDVSTVPVRHPAADLIGSAPKRQRKSLLETWRSRHDGRARLGSWLERAGTWLIVVDGDEMAHALAIRDHEIVAGYHEHENYLDWPIVNALKITNTKE